MPPTRPSPFRPYLVALACMAVATAARIAVDPLVGNRAPFATYTAAVAAVGLFGSPGAALLATGVAALAANYLFIPERYSFGRADFADTMAIVLFVASGSLIALLASLVERTRTRLREVVREQSQQAARLAVLSEITTTGLSGMGFEELAKQIARRAAKAVGEYCIIRMFRGDALEAVASAHVDPDGEEMAREIASHSNITALNRLYAELVADPRTIIDNDLPESAFDHVQRAGREAAFHKYRARRGLFTPLFSEGRLVGTLALGRAADEPYSADDAQFVEAIAARASLALENARLVEAARREAEEAQRARAEAEEAGRVKDEFLATLSHELRTPLNAILGWAHMLRDPELPAERQRAAIETILRNAQSQEQLISDILDVQRIVTGKIRLNIRAVDLRSVIQGAVETVQPTADARGITLHLALNPAASSLAGDPDRLQQVVWNLLSNAIKFAPTGGRVDVQLWPADGEYVLTVSDDGPGIDPAFMPYMFQRFRQADSSTTRTHKGLGLGLAIVRSLVEMHGGTITASNATPPRSGAVFTIRLPRRGTPAAAAAEEDPCAAAPWSDAGASLKGIHVLIVEDDRDARELLTTILQRCQADVTATASANEGWKAFCDHRPDVLISDIEMPGEDGYELIRRVRALSAASGGNVPAAALTAYASSKDRVKVLAAGFNMHLAKPVQPAELSTAVANLARRRP